MMNQSWNAQQYLQHFLQQHANTYLSQLFPQEQQSLWNYINANFGAMYNQMLQAYPNQNFTEATISQVAKNFVHEICMAIRRQTEQQALQQQQRQNTIPLGGGMPMMTSNPNIQLGGGNVQVPANTGLGGGNVHTIGQINTGRPSASSGVSAILGRQVVHTTTPNPNIVIPETVPQSGTVVVPQPTVQHTPVDRGIDRRADSASAQTQSNRNGAEQTKKPVKKEFDMLEQFKTPTIAVEFGTLVEADQVEVERVRTFIRRSGSCSEPTSSIEDYQAYTFDYRDESGDMKTGSLVTLDFSSTDVYLDELDVAADISNLGNQFSTEEDRDTRPEGVQMPATGCHHFWARTTCPVFCDTYKATPGTHVPFERDVDLDQNVVLGRFMSKAQKTISDLWNLRSTGGQAIDVAATQLVQLFSGNNRKELEQVATGVLEKIMMEEFSRYADSAFMLYTHKTATGEDYDGVIIEEVADIKTLMTNDPELPKDNILARSLATGRDWVTAINHCFDRALASIAISHIGMLRPIPPKEFRRIHVEMCRVALRSGRYGLRNPHEIQKCLDTIDDSVYQYLENPEEAQKEQPEEQLTKNKNIANQLYRLMAGLRINGVTLIQTKRRYITTLMVPLKYRKPCGVRMTDDNSVFAQMVRKALELERSIIVYCLKTGESFSCGITLDGSICISYLDDMA